MAAGLLHKRGFDKIIRWGIVLVVLVLIGHAGIPKLSSIKGTSPDSTAALAIMRNVAAVQKTIQSHPVIDLDHDGVGEFAFFSELAGTGSLRAHPDAPTVKLSPSLLSTALGKVDEKGCVKHAGYCFRMFMAGRDGRPIAESPYGGDRGAGSMWADPSGDVSASEEYFVCYAWPIKLDENSNIIPPAFMCNQSGDVFQTNNQKQKYAGPENGPSTGLEAYRCMNGDLSDAVSISRDQQTSESQDKGIWILCD